MEYIIGGIIVELKNKALVEINIEPSVYNLFFSEDVFVFYSIG